jgi:uncharacterized membrane protein
LQLVFARESRCVLVLFAFCLVAVRFFFTAGRLTLDGDATHHIMQSWIGLEGFKAGVMPVWTPVLSVGTVFVQFYGFVFAYLSGFLAWVIGDVETALKILLGVVHAASGVTCYLYTRALTGNRSAGFVAGVAYVLSFWHVHLVMIMGRFTVSLVFLLFLFTFWSN